MPFKCCAYGCNNRDDIAKLFRFPDDDYEKKEWLDLIQRENFTVTESSRLCSAHFRSSDVVETPGKLILKNNARPSIFNFPTTPTKQGGREKLINIVLFPSSNIRIDHSYSLPSTSFNNPLLNNSPDSSILVTDSNIVSESIVDESSECTYSCLSPHTSQHTPLLKRKIIESPIKSHLKKKVKRDKILK